MIRKRVYTDRDLIMRDWLPVVTASGPQPVQGIGAASSGSLTTSTTVPSSNQSIGVGNQSIGVGSLTGSLTTSNGSLTTSKNLIGSYSYISTPPPAPTISLLGNDHIIKIFDPAGTMMVTITNEGALTYGPDYHNKVDEIVDTFWGAVADSSPTIQHEKIKNLEKEIAVLTDRLNPPKMLEVFDPIEAYDYAKKHFV